MKLEMKNQDLFTVPEDYYLAHCISADYALGAGIAAEFERRFKLRAVLQSMGTHIYPDCLLVGKVFSLVTKPHYWDKPTYDSLRSAMSMLRGRAAYLGVQRIAMPRIGCGLDRLSWSVVRGLIDDVFGDTDIEILICSLEGSL